MDGVRDALSKQKKISKKIDDLAKLISYSKTIYWPGSSDKYTTDIPAPDEIKKWVSLSDDPKKIIWVNDLQLYLNISKPNGDMPQLTSTQTSKMYGIPYRQPELGRFSVCTKAQCGHPDAEPMIEQDGMFQQLGLIYFLNCTSRPFTSIGCTFEMSEDGRLKSIGTENKTAPLADATKALDGLVGNAGDVLAALKEDKTAKLKTQTDYLKAQADYAAAQKALISDPDATPAQIATLKLQADLANAKIAALDAEAALAAKTK
jgi:hypothetical protein